MCVLAQGVPHIRTKEVALSYFDVKISTFFNPCVEPAAKILVQESKNRNKVSIGTFRTVNNESPALSVFFCIFLPFSSDFFLSFIWGFQLKNPLCLQVLNLPFRL